VRPQAGDRLGVGLAVRQCRQQRRQPRALVAALDAGQSPGDAEIVDAFDGGLGRSTYGAMADRVLRLVTVLRDLGVQPGDRVGTFANNSIRHVELYYAVPLAGAVLHMVNIRLHDDQLEHVVADAGDTVLFVDDDLVPRLAEVAGRLPSVRAFVRLGKGDSAGVPGLLEGEQLLEAAEPTPLHDLPPLSEDDACGMCHTSGTTGQPKAVVYSHRSTFLHAMAACMVDALALSERERVLPVVPLFHACGWGLPYAAPFTGAELVLAGADTSPSALARVVESERVTWAAGVPTIWTSLLPLARSGDVDLSSLRTVAIGGSATPRALLEAYDELGIEILQIWGMTETSPVAAASRPRRRHRGLSDDELRDVRAMTGTVFAGLEARIVGDDGAPLPWDGESVGELECRGPWVATDYWGGMPEKFSDDGWLRTGDMAVMERDGYFRIVDRSKDLVKSGGEWISSVELEGHVLAHPAVREAAVVGVRSQKWDERPVVAVALERGASLTLAELQEFLTGRVARWWLPDDVVVVPEVPRTSVGKYDKKALRTQLADRVLP
jgi:fatty-acyl-CoA synthase